MVIAEYLQLSLREMLAFRVSFVLDVLTKIFDVGLFLFLWWVIFSTDPNLGDWTIYDVLVLLSLSEIYMAVFTLFFVGYFVLPLYVINGKLDNLLILPANPLLTLMGDQLQASRFARLVVALALFIISTIIHPDLSLGRLIFGLFIALLGLLLNNLLLASLNLLSFWIGKMGYLTQAISVTDDALFFPLSRIGGIVRLIFFLVLPLYFVSTFPTEIITHKLSANEIIGGILVLILLCIVWILIFKRLWQMGLEKYQSAGSL
jgi:ABC-2 type transport system permease protein